MSKANSKSESIALFGTANAEVTTQSLRAWLNANAGGDWSKVKIVKQGNVVADYQKAGLKGPVPFGYNGNPASTRALLQSNLLTVNTVAEHWTWCKSGPKAGIGTVKQHTANNPVCLLALLNGGYSPSSKTWGQAFIHLVAA
jgi:hypothetical protein